MATLEDLKPLWSDLTFEERLEVVKQIRNSRMKSKPAKSKAAKKRTSDKKRVLNILDGMSIEELEILAAKIEEKRK